jgi:hypothetical protein
MTVIKFRKHTTEGELEAAAREFHAKNKLIWKLYVERAKEVIKHGHRRYGSAAIWEWLRWEVRLQTKDDNFKLPNNHRPSYARWWNSKHPEFSPQFFLEKPRRGSLGRVDKYGRSIDEDGDDDE